MGRAHAIAAGHRLTAETGAEVLAAGGNAADAAVAAALMAMVTEPVLAGLLGGGFALVRQPSGEALLLDAFVDTPARMRGEAEADVREILADFGTVTQAFHIGLGTVAVPCLARGLADLHARLGRMPFRELVGPAARAARAGVEVTAFQALLCRIVKPILIATGSSRALFCEAADPDSDLHGDVHRAGASMRNPALADVLEEYGAEGARFVAEGEVAERFAALADDGGHLTRDDLASAAPVWRKPLLCRRAGVELALNPAPSLGGVLMAAAVEVAPRSPAHAELARVFDVVARARSAVALDTAPSEGAAQLLSNAVIADMRSALARPDAPRGTTHVSVVDRDGMGVALTLSNGEGCGTIIPGTGLMPNNMLGESDLVPNGPFGWRPGVRLASMMAPMALTWPDGRNAMLGSGGSNRIRTALAQVLLRLVDRGEALDAAILAPRLHLERAPGANPKVDFEEPGLAEGDRAALLEAYPEATPWPERSMFFGGVHAVMRAASGETSAFGDPRRDGVGLL